MLLFDAFLKAVFFPRHCFVLWKHLSVCLNARQAFLMNRIPTVLLRPHILLCLGLKEFFRLRLVSRDVFAVVTKASIPALREEDQVAPRACMVNMRMCMVCERVSGTRMCQKMVPYDTYPKRMFLYCQRVDCFTKMMASLLALTKEESRILLYDCSLTKHHFNCPRSAGGTTSAYCDKFWKHADGKVRAEWAVFYDNGGACYYQKDVHLETQTDFTEKILSFYK